MFEPNSITLLVLLFLAALGLLVVVIRLRHLAVKIVAGVLVVAFSSIGGMAAVNDYYGYYQTWSQLSADVSGSYASFAATPVGNRTSSSVQAGRLETVDLPGKASGINRSGLIYLPPQYFQSRYATTRFPVVELLHGTPGSPASWPVHLAVVQVADQLIAKHLMGPMILVMPTMSVGRDFQECVDAPGALDDTYITRDVRSDVIARFRASSAPSQWGVSGYSSGGYCAANLALRHRSSFGASAIMDGYFRPQDGPAAKALRYDAAAERANDPLLLATELSTDSSPLPSFWISAGTGVRVDIEGAKAFTHALHGVEQVTLYREPGAGHNFYAWQGALPHVLGWMWTQLAPTQLRVQFPIEGSVHAGTIKTVHPKRHHHRLAFPRLPEHSQQPAPHAPTPHTATSHAATSHAATPTHSSSVR